MQGGQNRSPPTLRRAAFDISGEVAPPMADYAKVRLGERERLKEEKARHRFFLSGHLFNACPEVRRFVRRTLAHGAERDPITMAAVAGLR